MEQTDIMPIPTILRLVFGLRVGGSGEAGRFTIDYRVRSFRVVDEPTYAEFLVTTNFYMERVVDYWGDLGGPAWYPTGSQFGVSEVIDLVAIGQGIAGDTVYEFGESQSERLQPGSNVYVTMTSADSERVRNGAVNFPAGTVDMLAGGLYRVEPVQAIVRWLDRLPDLYNVSGTHFSASGVISSRTQVDDEGIVYERIEQPTATREPRWLRSRQSSLSEKEQIRQNTRLSVGGRRGRRGATLRRVAARSYGNVP